MRHSGYDADHSPQESVPLDMQMQHLGQKYMGVRPSSHADAMFKDMSVQSTGNHPVPISNFMNAQCKLTAPELSVLPSG